MLQKLLIKNYALIDELRVEFGPGLNIITGETGAGKSIIIGALGLLLGERAQSDAVRQGESKAVVEGFFILPEPVKTAVAEFAEIEGSEIIIRREVSASGRSRAFINDSPVTGQILTQIGNYMADLHGQHQHQALLNTDTHLSYLDSFGVDKDLLGKLHGSYRKFRSMENQYKQLVERKQTARQKQELLEFQVKQITETNPLPGEEDALEQEEKILSNAEKITGTAGHIYSMLYEQDDAVSERLSKAVSLLGTLAGIDERLETLRGECDSARILVEEISSSIQDYAAGVEFDPQRLQQVRERLGLFTLLKKKYGPTIEEVLKYCEASKNELMEIDTVEEELVSLQKEMASELACLKELCLDVSDQRKNTAALLEKQIESALYELGLLKASFSVHLSQRESESGPLFVDSQGYDVHQNGIDRGEFFISLNRGEQLKPLAKVASGGEISRIMLSLKTVFADTDNIPVLIFDEIDNGISGRIARVVGKKLKCVSEKHQVICITHLPQIASLGDRHYAVEKSVEGERTVTHIRRLDEEARVAEVAKLLGGEIVTETARESAKELIFGKE